jgi:hypothetical protein
LPAEPYELSPHPRVLLGEQVAPTAVAELDQFRRRADDVGEENGREHAVGLDDVPLATIPHLAEAEGQVALIQRGEIHSKGSETGLTAVMIQVRDLALLAV